MSRDWYKSRGLPRRRSRWFESVFCGGNHVRRFIFLLILSLQCFSQAIAQSPNGTINGIVLDPSGAAIAGAEVVVVNDATGVQYRTKTNGEGIYVVPNLPPGPYRIQVSNSGFKTIIKPDIVIHVQDALAINFTLPIGAASEIVTVQGGAPLINAQNAAVSSVIDRKFVESLPLNGRSFNTLLQLTPGVVIAPALPTSPGQFSIAGQRTDANSFTVDGVSANFGVIAGAGQGQSGTGSAPAFSAQGGTSSLVSVDALQEFRIETSSFAPEFGRTPGGQVILSTRSGTNDFHGGAFDYFRNTVMDANDWFANAAEKSRAAEHHNDFGGFLGGPVWKDKTFFFFSYEGARLDQPQTKLIQVPSEYARTTAPMQLAPYLDAYPEPDDTASTPGIYTSQLTANYTNTAILDATSIRIDHNFKDRFTMFGRYNYAPSRIVEPIGNSASPSSPATTKVNTQTLTVGLNMVLGPRISNSLRANYSRQSSGISYALNTFGGAVPLNPNLLLGPLSSAQNLGYFQSFDTAFYLVGSLGKNQTQQLNSTDSLAITVGSHQLKFGGDYRSIFLDTNVNQHQMTYLAASVKDFLSTGSVLVVAGRTQTPAHLLTQSLSVFSQDTWRVTSRIALTYGLRWELNPAPSARGNTTLTAWQHVNNPAAIALAPFGTPLWSTAYGNFAPRFGVAYSLTPKGDFVFRAGAGIFYDLGVGSSAGLAFSFPNSASATFSNVSVPVPDVTPYLPSISVKPPYPTGVTGFSPDLKLPRSYQWNVALEKSFKDKHVISATYVGQAGRDLLRQQALYQPNANFAGALLLTLNDARSNYSALQLQYRKPLASGLQILLNYTWSHSLDNASDDVVAGLPGNIISAASDYSSSTFDVRQSFSGALNYDIPAKAKSGPLALLTKSWSLQSVIVSRSGFPFNAMVYVASPVPQGYALSRPDLVSGQPLWIPNQTAGGGKSLNPAALQVPTTPRQGTEGRNDIQGFGLTQVDLSIGRAFSITERLNLQFRGEAFNLFNHPNFTNPYGLVEFGPPYLKSPSMINQGLGGLTPLFQQGGPRSLQLSLKISF
jgi:hypothetical protein